MHDLTDAIAAAHAALDDRFYPGPTEEMVACIVEAAAPVIEQQIREQAAQDIEAMGGALTTGFARKIMRHAALIARTPKTTRQDQDHDH